MVNIVRAAQLVRNTTQLVPAIRFVRATQLVRAVQLVELEQINNNEVIRHCFFIMFN